MLKKGRLFSASFTMNLFRAAIGLSTLAPLFWFAGIAFGGWP
jgi:hypothetical protein